MRRMLVVGLSALLWGCDFDAALVEYCEGNPACIDGGSADGGSQPADAGSDAGLTETDAGAPDGGDGGLVDGGSSDGGSNDGGSSDAGPSTSYPAILDFGLQVAEPDTQLAGHLSPLTLVFSTSDGGLPDPDTVVLFDGGTRGAFYGADGGPVTQGRAGGSYRVGARVTINGAEKYHMMGDASFFAWLPDSGLGDEVSRAFGAQLYIQGASGSPAPMTQFTCRAVKVEAVAARNTEWVLPVNSVNIQLTADAGRLPIFTNGNCTGTPESSAQLVPGAAGTIFSVRLLDADSVTASVPGNSLFRPTSISYRMLPMYATLAFNGVEYDGGATVPVGRRMCLSMSASWRFAPDAGMAPNMVPAGQNGVFPFLFTTMGATLHSDVTCSQAGGGVLSLEAPDLAQRQFNIRLPTDAGAVLSVSFPDGGSQAFFNLN